MPGFLAVTCRAGSHKIRIAFTGPAFYGGHCARRAHGAAADVVAEYKGGGVGGGRGVGEFFVFIEAYNWECMDAYNWECMDAYKQECMDVWSEAGMV